MLLGHGRSEPELLFAYRDRARLPADPHHEHQVNIPHHPGMRIPHYVNRNLPCHRGCVRVSLRSASCCSCEKNNRVDATTVQPHNIPFVYSQPFYDSKRRPIKFRNSLCTPYSRMRHSIIGTAPSNAKLASYRSLLDDDARTQREP